MNCSLLVNRSRLDELKEAGLGFELGPIGALHLESPGHGTEGCRKRTTRGVFETLSRLESRLFADDARSVNFLGMARTVYDRPMSIQELNRRIAHIRNSNRVQKKPAAGGRVAVLRREASTDLDADACGFGLGICFEEIDVGHEANISRRGWFDGNSPGR